MTTDVKGKYKKNWIFLKKETGKTGSISRQPRSSGVIRHVIYDGGRVEKVPPTDRPRTAAGFE